MNPITKDLFLATFFNDLKKVKAILEANKEGNNILLLNLESGNVAGIITLKEELSFAYGMYWDSYLPFIPAYQITMLADSVWRNVSSLSDESTLDLSQIQTNISQMLQFWKDYYGVDELQEMDYKEYVSLIYSISSDDDEACVDEDDVKKHNINELDALLLNKSLCRNKKAVIELLQQGANPCFEIEHEFESAYQSLYSEESYQSSCYYVPLLHLFAEKGYDIFNTFDDDVIRGMFAALYGAGSSAELMHAIEKYSQFED